MNETVQAGDAKLAEIKAAGTSEGVRKSWLKRHATFNTHKQDMGSHEDWDMSKDEFDALKRRHGQTVAIKDIAVTVDESDPESHNYTVRFSDGHEAQVPGSLLDVHSNAPAGPHRVGSPRKNEHGEWVVPWFENGKRHEGRTYYTDSKDDAHDTHKHMSAMADKLNQESAAKASEFAEEGAVHCRDSGIVFADDQKWEVDKEVSFQWMPGGVTTMRPSYNGRPIHLTVRCDEKTAKVVQSSFEAWRKKYPKQEPFGCVEHREQEAAIRPNGFEWRNEPEPGVFCSARPTELGARNVNGRIHRSWSPSFRTDAEYDKCTCKDCRLSAAECQCGGDLEFPDGARGSASNPAEVIGVAFSVGSLTNKPAFKNILPVRAREEGEKDDEIKATGTSEGVRKAWETRARHLARTAHAASSKAYEHPGDSMLHREATEAHRAAAEHYRKAAHVDKAYEHKADWHERLADMHSRSAEDFEAGERKNESHVTSSDAILAEVAKERQKALESFEQSTPLTADAIFASLSGMK